MSMPKSDAEPEFNVLVVDDDRDAAESLAFCLQLDGRTVRFATSSEEALALAETWVPNLALVDLVMPRVDGYALAREIRRRYGGGVVLVAVTGALRDMEAGPFNFHLTKPVDFNQLQLLFGLPQQRGNG